LSSILYFKICPLLRRRQLAALRRYKTEWNRTTSSWIQMRRKPS
jgi:hypothetical protein